MTRLEIVTEQFLRTYKMIGKRKYYLIVSTIMLINQFKKCSFKFCVKLRNLVS